MTALDELCAVPFHDAPDDARARILSRLADTQLYAALAGDTFGDSAQLRLFDLPDGQAAVACDEEGRLAAFLDGPVPFAAMPGRVLARMLAQAGAGLLVNPGSASQMVLDAGTLGWLSGQLQAAPLAADGAPVILSAPRPDAVAALAAPLAVRLADLAGQAGRARLVSAQWAAPGSPDKAAGAGQPAAGHLLIIEGAVPDAQPAIAKALAETLAFLPEIEGGVDVAFDLPGAQGVVFDIPAPPQPKAARVLQAPGSDPARPPRLR